MSTSTVRVVLLIALARASIGAVEGEQDLRYNRATVIDITGVVEEIRELEKPAAVRGVHFYIRTENDARIDAYIGPTSFVKDFIASFQPRSEVQAIGSKVKLGNSVVLLTREVRKGEITLYLRDEDGTPNWNEMTLRPRRLPDEKRASGACAAFGDVSLRIDMRALAAYRLIG